MFSQSKIYTCTGSFPESNLSLHSITIPDLNLRLPIASDLPALVAILSNPANTKNDLSVSTLSPAARETLCRSWLSLSNPLTSINFLVHHGSVPIGISGLGWIGSAKPQSEENTEEGAEPAQDEKAKAGAAGVVINPEVRGKGLAYEALRISIDFGLRELELVEVRIGTPSENRAMRGLMERRFGRLPEPERERDRFGNDLLWRIKREEWLEEDER